MSGHDPHPAAAAPDIDGPVSGASMDRKVARTAWQRALRRLAPIALVAAAAGAWAWFAHTPSGRAVDAGRIEIRQVVQREFSDEVPLRGQVAPRVSTVIEATLAGTVEQLLVDDGVRVRQRQPLLRLRNPGLELQASEREAALLQQLAAALDARAQLERDLRDGAAALADAAFRAQVARSELDKQQMLHRSGFVSELLLERHEAESRFAASRHRLLQQEWERSQSLAAQRQTQLRDLQQRIGQTLDATRRALSGLAIVAPAGGVLTGLSVKPGQRLEVGTRIAQVDEDDGVKVVGAIDEHYLPRVAVGQQALATLGDRSLGTLRVAKVVPQVVSGRFSVELEFEGQAPSGLRRGQAVEARLRLSSPAPALVLPHAAFVSESGGEFVFRLDADGRAAGKVPVRLGRRNGHWVEVLEGLAAGDQVIVSSYADFKDSTTLALMPAR